MTSYRLNLPYFKQGDDLSAHLQAENPQGEKLFSTAGAFRAHAELMLEASKVLGRMAELAEVLTLNVQAGTHMICLSTSDDDHPLLKQLLADPEFPLEEDDP